MPLHTSLDGENLRQTYGDPSKFVATFTNTSFTGNWCGGSGGGLYAYAEGESPLTLTGARFFNNSVEYRQIANAGSNQGGAYYAFGQNLSTELHNCVVESNVAEYDGGGVAVYGGILTSANSTFLGNSVVSHGGGGGAIAALSDGGLAPTEIALSGGVLERNSAERASGGGIMAEARAVIRMYDTRAEGNNASSGGAISISDGAYAYCQGGEFIGNLAQVHWARLSYIGDRQEVECH